eukprot:943472-Pleurochrysis_carterae.AAC.1
MNERYEQRKASRVTVDERTTCADPHGAEAKPYRQAHMLALPLRLSDSHCCWLATNNTGGCYLASDWSHHRPGLALALAHLLPPWRPLRGCPQAQFCTRYEFEIRILCMGACALARRTPWTTPGKAVRGCSCIPPMQSITEAIYIRERQAFHARRVG